jgi:hypothetical protein
MTKLKLLRLLQGGSTLNIQKLRFDKVVVALTTNLMGR